MANLKRRHLFIVGPASVGKSTVGRALAKHLKVPYFDVDLTFNSRIENITRHIDAKGYESYARTNAALVEQLINESMRPTVFALPAGFLVHESVPGLAMSNLKLLKQRGLTILLLPSENPEDTADLIAARQLLRWGHIPGESERDRFVRRFKIYVKHGDIKVFSSEEPAVIVDKIEKALRLQHPYWFDF
jgi:shikimate kinase